MAPNAQILHAVRWLPAVPDKQEAGRQAGTAVPAAAAPNAHSQACCADEQSPIILHDTGAAVRNMLRIRAEAAVMEKAHHLRRIPGTTAAVGTPVAAASHSLPVIHRLYHDTPFCSIGTAHDVDACVIGRSLSQASVISVQVILAQAQVQH